MSEDKQKFLFDFLEKFHDHPYKSPQKADNDDEFSLFSQIAKDAKKANEIFNKTFPKAGNDYYLVDIANRNWRDGSNRKIRNYFWGQLKYATHFLSPISISVFAELSRETGKARYRVALEADDKTLKEEAFDAFYKFLDMPLDKEGLLCYAANIGKDKTPSVIPLDTKDNLISKIKHNEFSKIQLSYIIEKKFDYKQSYYIKELIKGVELLLPYYNKVLGVDFFEKK